MHTDPKLNRRDAFERAIRETFGQQVTPTQVEEARRLYARYRTDDLLNGLREAPPDKRGESQPWD
jgi:hypothetical protein